ncbi:MAG: VOC family protein [Deltaproteobacteria bacterium]|nr:VOC family protein [Deltaproteobacteria bacterium]
MIQHIHHTGLSTPDLDRSIRFYRDLFGFEVLARFTKPPGSPGMDAMLDLPGVGFDAALLRLGPSMIEVFEFSAPEPVRAPARRRVCDHGLTHLCFQVDDVRAEYARLSAAGMVFHCAPQVGDGATFVYGRDPDGNAIELIEFDGPDNPLASR